MLVAEVILPLPLDKLFHYAIPAECDQKVASGMRVLVQFGKRKEYSALVVRVLVSTCGKGSRGSGRYLLEVHHHCT